MIESPTKTPESRSADGLRRATRVRAVLHAATFSPAQKLLLLGLNLWPAVHLLGAVLGLLWLPWPMAGRTLAVVAWLLLLPPLLCRLAAPGRLPAGTFAVPSGAFFRWWMTWQLQMLFNRLPWIDETLRFVPGLYSLWLRLWGARIGRLTLWSPGVRIHDRPLIQIGHDVVIGIDARLLGHYGGLDETGRTVLTLGPVTIGDRTTIGGSALLAPGVVLDADQSTEALFLGAPFTRWQAGQRVPHPQSTSLNPRNES
jgi:hypothetical protein